MLNERYGDLHKKRKTQSKKTKIKYTRLFDFKLNFTQNKAFLAPLEIYNLTFSIFTRCC